MSTSVVNFYDDEICVYGYGESGQGHLKDTVERWVIDDEEDVKVLCRCSWNDGVDGSLQRTDVQMIGRDDRRPSLQHGDRFLDHQLPA